MSTRTSNSWKKLAFSALIATAVIAASIFIQTRRTVEAVNIVGSATPALAAGVASGYDSPGIPVRIQAPSIGLDAKVQETGFAKDGTSLGVPTNCTDTAWYENGPRPGAPGSAVIDGHVECKTMPKAVFYSIADLEVGATLMVTDDKGTVRTFVVTGKKSYSYTADASDVFLGDQSNSELNLITCTGTWMPAVKLYDQRMVVFTKLVK